MNSNLFDHISTNNFGECQARESDADEYKWNSLGSLLPWDLCLCPHSLNDKPRRSQIFIDDHTSPMPSLEIKITMSIASADTYSMRTRGAVISSLYSLLFVQKFRVRFEVRIIALTNRCGYGIKELTGIDRLRGSWHLLWSCYNPSHCLETSSEIQRERWVIVTYAVR